jgi:hypothetical protein
VGGTRSSLTVGGRGIRDNVGKTDGVVPGDQATEATKGLSGDGSDGDEEDSNPTGVGKVC